MKRMLALLLAAVMLLSLCACGKKNAKPDASGQIAPVEEEQPSVLKVDITMENFYDFFGYKEYRSAAKSESTGEITSMQILYGYELKDGFTAETSPLYPSDLTVVFQATGIVNQGEFNINYDTLEYTGNVTSTETIPVEEDLEFWAKGNRTEIWAFGNYSRSYVMYLTDFRLRSVSGTIYLNLSTE